MSTKIQRQFDPNYKGTAAPVGDSVSKTVPDMTLTIRQLLENHTRGYTSGVKEYQGEYFDDLEIPVFEDLTDVVEFRQELIEREKKLLAEIEEERQAEDKKIAAEKAEFEKLVADYEKHLKAQKKVEKKQSKDKNSDEQ